MSINRGTPDKNRATASNSNCFVLFRYLTLADMFPQDTAKHICGSCAYNLNCCKCQRTSRFLSRSLISLTSRLRSRCGTVVQRKTYSAPIVQGNGGTHLFP